MFWPSKRGETHKAFFHAKIEDCLKYDNLDQRIVKMASERLGNLGSEETTTPQGLFVLQVIGESYGPKKYKELFDYNSFLDEFSPVLDSFSKRKESGYELPDYYGDSKVWVEQGYLVKNGKGEFTLVGKYGKENSMGFGVCMEFDNNSLTEVSEQDCKDACFEVTNLIRFKYPKFATVVQQKSF